MPEVDYRMQGLHEHVIVNCGAVLFVVGTSCIEYAVVVVMPRSMINAYLSIVKFVERKHLFW